MFAGFFEPRQGALDLELGARFLGPKAWGFGPWAQWSLEPEPWSLSPWALESGVLNLESECMRKHTLFALENGQGCGIAGLGAAGIASNTCFLASCFGCPGPGASRFDSGG